VLTDGQVENGVLNGNSDYCWIWRSFSFCPIPGRRLLRVSLKLGDKIKKNEYPFINRDIIGDNSAFYAAELWRRLGMGRVCPYPMRRR